MHSMASWQAQRLHQSCSDTHQLKRAPIIHPPTSPTRPSNPTHLLSFSRASMLSVCTAP